MSEENIYVDRYTALGIPYPDPATVCHGQCEGTASCRYKTARNAVELELRAT